MGSRAGSDGHCLAAMLRGRVTGRGLTADGLTGRFSGVHTHGRVLGRAYSQACSHGHALRHALTGMLSRPCSRACSAGHAHGQALIARLS